MVSKLAAYTENPNSYPDQIMFFEKYVMNEKDVNIAYRDHKITRANTKQ